MRSQWKNTAGARRGRWLSLLLPVLLGWGGCGAAEEADEFGGASPAGLTAHEQQVLDREARLGLTRVIHENGTFEYRLPATLETPAVRREGGLTWRYQGQVVQELKPQPLRPVMIYDAPESRSPRQDIEGQNIGTVSADEYGRRWVVSGVDRERTRAMVAEYDTAVQSTVGLEPAPLLSAPVEAVEAPGAEGQWVTFTPASWTRTDCSNDGLLDTFVWDTDDRTVTATPMNVRQRKVLLLLGPRGTCSGTMVDNKWLLTAAHCVTNASGTPYSATAFDACTYGNYQTGAACYSSTSVVIAPGYSGDGDFNDDYAVVKLDAEPGVGWMAISQASNSVVEAAQGYNVGYPGYAPGCNLNRPARINRSFTARRAYKSNGDVINLTTNKIKTRIEVSAGHSGGPFFYYPGGCCGAHYITGVVSGHMNLPIGKDYNGGPKGSAIRTWVISNTP